MKQVLQNAFPFDIIELKKLNGYENENFLVKSDKQNYIFKTYKFSEETLAMVEAENETLLYLQQKNQANIPQPIPFKDGSYIKTIYINGTDKIARMLTFLDGTFYANLVPSKKLFHSLGNFLAELNLNLQDYTNYTIRARQWEWDLQYLHLNKKYIQDIPNAKDRNIVHYFFQQFEEQVVPALPYLRKSIIHNDANEWNILANENQVTGIIDFGDLAYSPLINELAIAITYACYDKDQPIEWAIPILESYHKKMALEEKEIDLLYYLIAARLCTSVCNSAHSKITDPSNAYASVSEKSAWKMLYHLLQINPMAMNNRFRQALGFPIKEVITDKIKAQRTTYFSPALSLSYQHPIHMERAAFQYMYDADGNTFLDAYNNIPHVGHSHPKVVAAAQGQVAKLNTNTRYLYNLLTDYAEKLLAKFPPSLNKVFFVNSGSEASDLAIRMAKTHTKRDSIMVMEHGYHGHTQIGIDISDYKFNHPKGQGIKDYILKTVIPDSYRGKYKDAHAGKKYAQDAIQLIEQSNNPIAAFIAEPIVGCGGQVPLAKGYLKALYPHIRNQGGLCISDEVQTGFGRLGDYFWGFELQEVIPDIVIIGKPMGNAHPIGAVVTTTEIAESFGKGVEFFSSFGGNPVSCAIGLAVLEVIEEEALQENAKVVGHYYKSLLLELKDKYTCIGDVRGSGLFLGIELVKKGSMEPDPKLAKHIKNELRKQHILISTDGPWDSVLKTKPPLCFTKENAEQVVRAIEKVLHNKS